MTGASSLVGSMSPAAFSGGVVKRSTCPGAPAPPTLRPVLPSRERRSLHCVTRKTIKGCLLSKCLHETFIGQPCNTIGSFSETGKESMSCFVLGFIRVRKTCERIEKCPSAAGGVGDVTPRPALGPGQSCSLLPAVAVGGNSPSLPRHSTGAAQANRSETLP